MGKTIWLTGLSGSGKTTIAKELRKKLINLGIKVKNIDGDELRAGICSDLGFSIEDRKENIRRTAEIAKMFNHEGFFTACSFISPTERIRNIAKKIIGRENFIEVYINTPLNVCEHRDPKGLYKKARQGLIQNFTGIDAPFEEPINPNIIVSTINQTIEQCANQIYNSIL
jgi:adenylylsulfate kinase